MLLIVQQHLCASCILTKYLWCVVKTGVYRLGKANTQECLTRSAAMLQLYLDLLAVAVVHKAASWVAELYLHLHVRCSLSAVRAYRVHICSRLGVRQQLGLSALADLPDSES